MHENVAASLEPRKIRFYSEDGTTTFVEPRKSRYYSSDDIAKVERYVDYYTGKTIASGIIFAACVGCLARPALASRFAWLRRGM